VQIEFFIQRYSKKVFLILIIVLLDFQFLLLFYLILSHLKNQKFWIMSLWSKLMTSREKLQELLEVPFFFSDAKRRKRFDIWEILKEKKIPFFCGKIVRRGPFVIICSDMFVLTFYSPSVYYLSI